mmetsp:Transcript_17286/g.65887  ORF Transcript_17286/g.65887 Transcript_17286/m.65887 type:complete len:240 (-) Transcript_17286:231-950(-)
MKLLICPPASLLYLTLVVSLRCSSAILNKAPWRGSALAKDLLKLVDVELGQKSRGSEATLGDKARVDRLVEEIQQVSGAVSEAEARRLLPGRWRLLYTSRPNTGLESLEWFQYLAANGPSPIQRFVIGATAQVTLVYQEIDEGVTRFSNVIDFEEALGGKLNLNAAVERLRGAKLEIRFDNAYFDFSRLPGLGPRRLPYPVPFRLLPGESRGSLDTLYVDGEVRIAQGNKGTIFILKKM